jgi:hypothetical protein
VIPELLAQQPVTLDWLANDVIMAEKGDFEPPNMRIGSLVFSDT